MILLLMGKCLKKYFFNDLIELETLDHSDKKVKLDKISTGQHLKKFSWNPESSLIRKFKIFSKYFNCQRSQTKILEFSISNKTFSGLNLFLSKIFIPKKFTTLFISHDTNKKLCHFISLSEHWKFFYLQISFIIIELVIEKLFTFTITLKREAGREVFTFDCVYLINNFVLLLHRRKKLSNSFYINFSAFHFISDLFFWTLFLFLTEFTMLCFVIEYIEW